LVACDTPHLQRYPVCGSDRSSDIDLVCHRAILSTSSIWLLETRPRGFRVAGPKTCHKHLLLGLPHFLCAVTSSKSIRCATGEQLKNMHVPELCRLVVRPQRRSKDISLPLTTNTRHTAALQNRASLRIHQYAAVYNTRLRTPSRFTSLVGPRKQVEFAICKPLTDRT